MTNPTTPTPPTSAAAKLRKRDTMQQIRNEIQHTLLLHAPERWTDERLDEVEQIVMGATRRRLGDLSLRQLFASGTTGQQIWVAVSHTKELTGVRRFDE